MSCFFRKSLGIIVARHQTQGYHFLTQLCILLVSSWQLPKPINLETPSLRKQLNAFKTWLRFVLKVVKCMLERGEVNTGHTMGAWAVMALWDERFWRLGYFTWTVCCTWFLDSKECTCSFLYFTFLISFLPYWIPSAANYTRKYPVTKTFVAKPCIQKGFDLCFNYVIELNKSQTIT